MKEFPRRSRGFFGFLVREKQGQEENERKKKAKRGASPQHTRLEEGHLDRLQRKTRGEGLWLVAEEK